MRPKSLKFPFKWEDRRPALYEGILIVPKYFENHELWKDETNLFDPAKSLFVEYCSGNGDWIIEKALQFPERQWVAVEMQFERVRKIWSKMHNQKVENLLIVCGEALTFTRHYLPPNTIEEIFVNFPDPWPKKKHAKHRIIQEPFVNELFRVIKNKGKATYVTDDPTYSSQMIEQMHNHSGWKSPFPAPFYKKSLENYGHSWFENLWRLKGREFFYMEFEKQ